MPPHPYGWLSLLPPVVAIVLAVATRRAFLSLLAGIFCGALVTTGGNPFSATYDLLEVHLWPTAVDPGRLRIFSFTLLMGAMIGVICRCGGMQGLIRIISPLAQARRGGQLTTWFLGLLIFFDDYANTILLGGTLRPVCDRLRISREKLAYLVDSTAAPVAGLSLLSTWVAIELDYIREGLEALGTEIDVTAIDLFLGSIPYRFYILMSLVFIPFVALTGRDFGPMLKAERDRLKKPILDDPLVADEAGTDGVPARWYNAVVPIVCTLGTVMWLLYHTGQQSLAAAGALPPTFREILGAADANFALQYGALVGLALVSLMSLVQRILSWDEIKMSAFKGAQVVLPAILILWSATSLSRMTGSRDVEGQVSTTPYEFKDHRLYTGEFLTQFIQPENGDAEGLDAAPTQSTTLKLFPTGVFILAAILAFATGTSFGTMGILVPLVITLSYALLQASGVAITADNPILLASVGGVLAGAVFGDHCSPISDTTILSSLSCDCDHIAHVVTQMPYALSVGAVCILFGTLPLGWGVSVWILLPLQILALFLVINFAGTKVEQPDELPVD